MIILIIASSPDPRLPAPQALPLSATLLPLSLKCNPHCSTAHCTLHNSTIQQHRFTLSFCTYSSIYCCISFVKCAVQCMELLIALYFGYFTQMKSLVLQCIACTLSYNVLVGKLTNLRGAFPFLINLTSQPPLSEFTPNDVCLVSCHLTNRNGKCLGKLSFYIVQSGIIQFLTSL